MRILGIDPGSRITGYGVVDFFAGKMTHIDNGGIHPNLDGDFHSRLLCIHQSMQKIITAYQPHAVTLERIFHGKNIQSMIKLGEARGAALIAVLERGLPVFEYSPTQIKLALTGYGRASKAQIQEMSRRLLHLKEVAMTDAADALALAICHLQSMRFHDRVKTSLNKS